MRTGRAAVLGWLLALAAAAAGQEPLRIGTWNLEQLGFRREQRSEEDYRRIAAVVRGLRVDVLAVQEIGGPAPMRRLCAHLGPDYAFVLGTTGGFRGDPGRISVGFVWRRDAVDLVQAEELLDLPRESEGLPIFHRVPVSAVFRSRRGGLDLRAVVVHFKAGRGTTNERKRHAEVTAVAEYLRGLAADPDEDRDVVLLGDFNHTYGSPAHVALQRHEVVRYLTPPRPRPTILHFPEPIDHVAIAPGLEEELLADSHVVHGEEAEADPDGWRRACSDHVPVTVDLDDTADRDPDARFRLPSPAHRLFEDGAATPAAALTVTAFAVGTEVSVVTVDDRTHEGTLLAPLGEWVVLRLTEGGQIAIPAQRVLSVHARGPR